MHEPPPSTERLPAPPAAGAALPAPQSLWDAITAITGEIVAVVDRQGIIRYCNRVADGFSMQAVVGHSLVRFTVPESSARILATLGEVFETGEPRRLESTVRRLNGELAYFDLRLGPVASGGGIEAVMVCCESLLPPKVSQRALDHERHLLRRLLEIQEQERQLVSYDIHDGVCQYLAGAMMQLQAFQHAHPECERAEAWQEGLRLLRSAVQESRRLIGGLRPPALDELGIVAAVESLIAEAREAVPEVELVATLPPHRLPPTLETGIFRIVQESLTNVRKHAGARKVRVDLAGTPTAVTIRVSDDGRGFDPAAVPDDRFGLEGIRQRCRLLGGEPRIASTPGGGTVVEVTLPVAVAAG